MRPCAHKLIFGLLNPVTFWDVTVDSLLALHVRFKPWRPGFYDLARDSDVAHKFFGIIPRPCSGQPRLHWQFWHVG